MKMEEQAFAQRAQENEGAGDVLLFEENLEADSVRKLAVAVMESCQGRCADFTGMTKMGISMRWEKKMVICGSL